MIYNIWCLSSQTLLASGPRILTFFLYLSDVEEGGYTNFPNLGIAVQPKKGRALLWPSTTTANPNVIDGRTLHEAQPVISGVKYAANAWIHLYNFQIPNLWGCTGTFDNL
jgi:prolyl 4-hydroxylase